MPIAKSLSSQRLAYIVPPPVIPFLNRCLQKREAGGYILHMKNLALLVFALVALTNSHAYSLDDKRAIPPSAPRPVGAPAAGAINGEVCGAFNIVYCWKTA